jgi:hypothetical protein
MMANYWDKISLTREETFEFWLNECVFKDKAGRTQAYPMHLYYDNDKGIRMKNAFPICIYNGIWHYIKQHPHTREPKLGELVPEVHQYDCEDMSASDSTSDTSNHIGNVPIFFSNNLLSGFWEVPAATSKTNRAT